MLERNDIDNDYSMYFFNYPNNSYVMTLEEKIIYDAIIHNDEKVIDKQDTKEIIEKVIDEKSSFVIIKAFNELKDYDFFYGTVVLLIESLFSIAFRENREYTLRY